MNPVRGIETQWLSVPMLYFLIQGFQINESRSRDWNCFSCNSLARKLTFKLMNPVRGIETFLLQNNYCDKNKAFKLMNPVRGIETTLNYNVPRLWFLCFQINESRSRDWNNILSAQTILSSAFKLMNPVRGIETKSIWTKASLPKSFKLMNPVRGIETRFEPIIWTQLRPFKLMNPVRGIETNANWLMIMNTQILSN